MDFPVLKTKSKIFLSSLAVAVILLLAIFWGLAKGKEDAESQAVLAAQANLVKGLQFFYQDQNRYPSALEFVDAPTMLNYFNSFPPPDFASKNCSQSFSYQRNALDSYSLSFCLPVSSGGFAAGWNAVSGSPPQQNQSQ